MVEREFLGWERPFLTEAVEWLWRRKDELPGWLVVVPTAQSGRRLREALAERGSCLAPHVVTPGWFLHADGAAPDSIELLAWVETLEAIRDWSPFEAVFPISPGEGEARGWSLGLARSLAGLRKSLQENALTIATASERLLNTVEAERWQALAALEDRVEHLLGSWGCVSRSAALARPHPGWQDGWFRVVLAGVPDFFEAIARQLGRAQVPVTALVGAPAEEVEHFDAFGRPAPSWNERPIAWPAETSGSVTLVADPRQQASEALRLAAIAGTSSDRLVLGTADEETAGELVRAFGRAGWTLHDPAHQPPRPFAAWLAAWRRFLADPVAATAIDLLAYPQTAGLVGGRRAQRAAALSLARDRWLAKQRADFTLALEQTSRTHEQEQLHLAASTLESLEEMRAGFARDGFHAGMRRLLEVVDPGETAAVLHEWLAGSAPSLGHVERDAGFWIDLLLASLPPTVSTPPAERALDVQGWLELFHEPGPHLIVCGMNEGWIPGRGSSDAWLPENVRGLLGLSTEPERAARDAYLLTAMTACRKASGRVDLLLVKTGAGGETLLPSRLLLAAPEGELPARVKELFRGIEPPDSSLAWTLDEAWKWRPREVAMAPRLSVTAFADYLACPFRFYLKQVAGMAEPEPERVEWNARDFGNVAHLVLERWALDEAARDFLESEAIEAFVHDELDRILASRFDGRLPLAVRIQTESLRQRLSWFARVQARERQAGWRIAEVEKKFELDLDGFIVVGRVDRIERHEDGRRRVLDYKTTAAASVVEQAHRVAVTANTRLPAHLENVKEVLCTASDGKTKRWKNLQVALYSAALGDVDELGYFALGATEADVKVSLWDGFFRDDRESALDCARWVTTRVAQRAFWPPAERVDFDDYAVLSLGRLLEETVTPAGGAA